MSFACCSHAVCCGNSNFSVVIAGQHSSTNFSRSTGPSFSVRRYFCYHHQLFANQNTHCYQRIDRLDLWGPVPVLFVFRIYYSLKVYCFCTTHRSASNFSVTLSSYPSFACLTNRFDVRFVESTTAPFISGIDCGLFYR